MSETTSAPIPVVKPGWKTTEFWLHLAAVVLTALFASGVIPTGSLAEKIAAMAATVLGALGYSVGRSFVKSAGPALVLIFLFAGSARADEPAPPLSPPAAAAVAALRVDAAQAQLAALSRDTATAPVPVTPPTVAQKIEQVAMCAASSLPAAISSCLGPKAPPPMDTRTFWTAIGAGLGANVTTIAGLIIAHYLPPVPMGQTL